MLTVLNGPSASGKTTLMEMILNGNYGKQPLPIQKLLTVTTRPPRVGEVDGVHYRFMTPEEFDIIDRNGGMAEKTEYAGVKYGILKEDLEILFDPLNNAIVVLDFWGYAKMCEFLGRHNVDLVFVYAGFNTLRKRMIKRGDSEEVIKRRLEQAKEKEFVGSAFASLIINTEESLEDCYKLLYHHLKQSIFRISV